MPGDPRLTNIILPDESVIKELGLLTPPKSPMYIDERVVVVVVLLVVVVDSVDPVDAVDPVDVIAGVAIFVKAVVALFSPEVPAVRLIGGVDAEAAYTAAFQLANFATFNILLRPVS